jgi:hypothetical protein
VAPFKEKDSLEPAKFRIVYYSDTSTGPISGGHAVTTLGLPKGGWSNDTSY